MGRRSDFTEKAYSYARRSIENIFGSKALRTRVEQPLEQKYLNAIAESPLFDSVYYLRKNPDVKKSGMDPAYHFLHYGGIEGRDPSTLFSSVFYLKKYADVREARTNPLIHYLTVGLGENRKIKDEKTLKDIKPKSSGKKRIDIINVNFYDWTGEVLYKGGAERYVYDLAVILKKLGHTPRIIQNATKEFTKNYRGVEVVGVATGALDAQGSSLRQMSAAFNEVCRGASLIIASPIDLACEITAAPVIGINHGIHWDSVLKHLYNNRTSDYEEIFDALERVKLGVCVDTNFINWTRTYDYSMGEKLRYIPNYYDKDEFKPVQKDFNGRLKVMYPRRLYDARGIFITIDAFDYLLGKYKNIDLLLVGQTTDPKVIKRVNALIKKYKNQVALEEYEMQDMHKAYAKSNVVLIPTRYAEGTSLSCLEAMATHNTLIATNIGGLPNLVIDRFNGLLIDPNANALIDAVSAIASDRKYAKELADNALNMVKVFEKVNWDQRWLRIFQEEL